MSRKVICLSYDSCCGGPKAARVELRDDKVYIKDRHKRIKILTMDGWEIAKSYILSNCKLPNNLRNKISLNKIEMDQLILFLKDESNINPIRITEYIK